MLSNFALLVLAYILGSIPTALIVARVVGGVDIRSVGDGNMGARNVARTLGLKYGLLVAVMDIGKGALAVLLVSSNGLGLGWQLAAGGLAALGHDYPVFAGFKGGQGLAVIVGGLWVLMPLEISIGMAVYLILLIALRKSSLGAGIGMGLSLLLAVVLRRPLVLIIYVVLINLSIPVKQLLDAPRRHHIESNQEAVENRNSHRV